MGKKPSVESVSKVTVPEHDEAGASELGPARGAKRWTLLLVGILSLALVVVLGGVLRGALASSGPTILPTPSGVPTIYISDPPPPGPATTPTDQAPIEPAPASTVVPRGVAAPNPQPEFGTLALDLLARIPVQPAAAATGYARSNFGLSWLDLGKGCDSRNSTLKRDLGSVVFAAGSASCLVQNGELTDPYSGGRVLFDRTTASMIQIDEVVSLANAWQTGAQQLSPAQRIGFANDPLNLLAVDAVSSLQKRSADAASWLPSNTEFRCSYVARQISVKATYGLWVTPSEHDAMAAVLATCPTTTAPTDQLPARDLPELEATRNTGTQPGNKGSAPQSSAGRDSVPRDSVPREPAQNMPGALDNGRTVPMNPAPPMSPPNVPEPPQDNDPWAPNSFPSWPYLPEPYLPEPHFPVPPSELPFDPWNPGPISWSQWPIDPPVPVKPAINAGSPSSPVKPPRLPRPVTVPVPTGPLEAEPSHWGLPVLPTMLGR